MNESTPLPFCSPQEFYSPGLEFYGWADTNLTFTGYMGTAIDWVDTQRTLFINYLDTHLLVSLPSKPAFLQLSEDTLDHAMQQSALVVSQGNVPVEFLVNFSQFEKPGLISHPLELQVLAIDNNDGQPLCQLPSSNLTLLLNVLEPDLNYMGELLWMGWIMIAVIWALCLASLAWIHIHRRNRAVRIMQPLFLRAVTLGVAIFGASIWTISISDENATIEQAETACIVTPWLVITGLTLLSSAMFSKLWRINKIFQGARQYRKLRVRERDVLGPFLVWFLLNTTILTLRTILAPSEFARVGIDGNPANTIGTCEHEGTASVVLYFANVTVTLSAFLAAAYQGYLARNISDEYSESRSLLWAIVIWTEMIVIGVPVIFLVGFDSPRTQYFVNSIMIFGLCISMLGSIYIPLWQQVRKLGNARDHEASTTSGGSDTHGRSELARGQVHVSGISHPVTESDMARQARSSETTFLKQKVADLELQIARLQERNQVLESILQSNNQDIESVPRCPE